MNKDALIEQLQECYDDYLHDNDAPSSLADEEACEVMVEVIELVPEIIRALREA